MSSSQQQGMVFTIGHSTLKLERVFRLLREAKIETLVDVRSSPISSFVPDFDRDVFEVACDVAGVRYIFMGEELGGRPRSSAFYDNAGHALYWKMAGEPGFRSAIKRLAAQASASRTAVMCSEENPVFCHRRLLLMRPLAEVDVDLQHIRADGRLQTEADLWVEAMAGGAVVQDSLDSAVDPKGQWKSIRSVWRAGAHKSSSRRS
jgi:uncharacterized protein (DUF488 family)